MIKKEMESFLSSGNVSVEEFTAAPMAFLGSMPVIAFLMLCEVFLNITQGNVLRIPNWAAAAAALVLSILSLLIFIFEYILYYEFTDPFFRKKQSVNVIGTLCRPGTGDVKQLLIISGHHDSALEFTWLRLLKYGFYITIPTILIGIITMLVMSLLQLTTVITDTTGIRNTGMLGTGMLIYPVIPSVILSMFFTHGWKNGGVVPGAADNLSASALILALCRFFTKNPDCIPKDTEIRFISFGSEEAGLRGSKRYVKRHLDELIRMDARLLNLETVAYPEITILTSELNGIVKNSPKMIKSLTSAALRAGVPYRTKPFPIGGGASDACSFSRAGIKAAALLPFKVPQQMTAFYHQKWDTPKNLTMEPLSNVLKLVHEWVLSSGKEG
jgi:hypothetical protein